MCVAFAEQKTKVICIIVTIQKFGIERKSKVGPSVQSEQTIFDDKWGSSCTPAILLLIQHHTLGKGQHSKYSPNSVPALVHTPINFFSPNLVSWSRKELLTPITPSNFHGLKAILKSRNMTQSDWRLIAYWNSSAGCTGTEPALFREAGPNLENGCQPPETRRSSHY